MPAHKLILLPSDPQTGVTSCTALAASLQGIGLIGAVAVCAHGEFYPAGDNFLQLVSFLGCSPDIELDPPAEPAQLDAAVADGRFCHVALSCRDTLRFRMDPQARPPRCPHCGQPESGWLAQVRQWKQNPAKKQWSCTGCGFRGELPDLVFRKQAGFGKVFVEIRGIYPSEALPGTALLATLRTLTGGDWQYIYIKE